MASSSYVRYHISPQPAPDIAPHPNRFRVEVKRTRLAALLLKDLYYYHANLAVVSSRPCVYGTFSGPVGGFAVRPAFCVGCLRCTVEHPDVVQIRPNPQRARLGDSYFTPDKVDTVMQEAATGQIPVRGAGYRGAFAGQGWDSMWTDMSEIVRPTRDGIHGREFISTAVDVGERPAFLTFDAAGNPCGPVPRSLNLPIPFLFDVPAVAAESATLYRGLVEAAARLQTLAIVPVRRVLDLGLHGPAIAPLATPAEIELLQRLPGPPQVAELDAWEESAFHTTRERFPETAVFVRIPLERDLMPLVCAGVRLFHLTADYHGRCGGPFARDAIRTVHASLVKDGLREETVLIGSGGVITASDVAKAIVCGLDAVALDTAVLAALQAGFEGECVSRTSAVIRMPEFEPAWAAQRLTNLVAAWRDQILEILGAMGLREVRRLRGELGRAMFQEELERDAFTGIAGFEE